MSYILDALRKADADRERDPARGIHAHPVAAPAASDRSRAWPLAAGGVAALALVVAGIVWWPREEPQRPTPVAPSPVPAQAPAAAALPPAPPPLAPAAGRVAAPMANTPVAAASMAQAPALRASVALAPASAPARVAPAAPAASAPERTYSVAELPPEVQRELPKLVISGGVYSDNASQRMLIVAGQVANEGTEVAPGLVLEQIRPRSAVLRFRGFRYSVPY